MDKGIQPHFLETYPDTNITEFRALAPQNSNTLISESTLTLGEDAKDRIEHDSRALIQESNRTYSHDSTIE